MTLTEHGSPSKHEEMLADGFTYKWCGGCQFNDSSSTHGHWVSVAMPGEWPVWCQEGVPSSPWDISPSPRHMFVRPRSTWAVVAALRNKVDPIQL
ncbi:hypothetical protein HaLaN_01178, partial [Haematococcus lacustris]